MLAASISERKGGAWTEEIARAFLTSPPTLAQRIVRAKSKIRDARIPYKVPEASELADRLETVLQVIYLVFNEGYSASSGESPTRRGRTSCAGSAAPARRPPPTRPRSAWPGRNRNAGSSKEGSASWR